MKEKIELFEALLKQYQTTEMYKSDYSKGMISALFICCNLCRLKLLGNHTFYDSDNRWFENQYGVARFFDSDEWKDMHLMYSELSLYFCNNNILDKSH